MLLRVSGNIRSVDGEPEAEVRRRVGTSIKLRRTDLGLTQDELAAAAGVSVRAVSGAETGERLPRGVTSRAYERALAWEVGSIDRIVEGHAPVELAAPRPDPVGSSLDAAADEVGLSEEERAAHIALIRARRRLSE